MRVLTLAEIHTATRTDVPLLGGVLRVRRISSREYLKHMPEPLEDVPGEPAEARQARVEEWTKLHADAIAEGQAQVVALASLDPKLSVEDARGLGNEVIDVAAAIFTFSFRSTAAPLPADAP